MASTKLISSSFFMFFMLALLLVLLDSSLGARLECREQCCLFMENFPGKLKNLRHDFKKIRNYYEDTDDLEMALLDSSLLQNFKSPYGCHAVRSVLRFYRDTVLPSAVADARSRRQELQTSIDSIGSAFQTLMRDFLHCKKHFSCKEPFDINNIITSYNGMNEKGVYKAMGELDLLLNYIEDYLVSKRQNSGQP
uniref:Interleukin family protein n=1 Tax=Denticeps clupeoides TaxID=299321 RepID=A0AAY4EEQ5_9TELE